MKPAPLEITEADRECLRQVMNPPANCADVARYALNAIVAHCEARCERLRNQLSLANRFMDEDYKTIQGLKQEVARLQAVLASPTQCTPREMSP